jgi:hypothetical protein
MIREVDSETKRVKRIFEMAANLPDDLALQSHWASYSSIVISGYLENCLRAIFIEFASKHCNPKTARYAESAISRFQNPDTEKISKLVREFSQDWFDSLERFWSGRVKDHVASVVNLRHNVAHGRSSGTPSIGRLRQYFESVLELVEFIHAIVLPNEIARA